MNLLKIHLYVLLKGFNNYKTALSIAEANSINVLRETFSPSFISKGHERIFLGII